MRFALVMALVAVIALLFIYLFDQATDPCPSGWTRTDQGDTTVCNNPDYER